MNIQELCKSPAVTAPASASLSEIAQLMRQHHVGSIVVTKSPVDQPVPIGIITDRDIVRTQLQRATDLSSLNAMEGMTRDPLVLEAHVSVEEAIQKLRQRGVRRAPIVNASGKLIGVISMDDLLVHVAEQLTMLACLLGGQLRQEPS